MIDRPFQHGVVAGGGMAGLMAARVLSDHFERVTLVERDAFSGAPVPRKGVPQGQHVHVLLIRGRSILERLFPGLVEELRAEGAVVVNAGRELGWHHGGGWRVKHDSDLSLLTMSRPLLETKVAARVRAIPNVAVLDERRVEGFRTDDDGAVTGLRTATAGGEDADSIAADLVVDCMGRGSATPRWVAELGFSAPKRESLPVRVTYATCLFPRRDDLPGDRALFVSGSGRRGAALVPIEGGRWLLTAFSYGDEPAPQDIDAMRAFARSLGISAIGDVVGASEPLSDVVRYRFAGSQRQRYDRLSAFPEGLIVLGDGVCSFNPIYGQGMTVSAIEAECLDGALALARREGGIGPGFAQRWFATIRPVIDAAWEGALLEDLRFPEMEQARTARLGLLRWYMDRVHRATHRSPVVADQFYRVANFLEAPTSLLRPRVLATTLFGG